MGSSIENGVGVNHGGVEERDLDIEFVSNSLDNLWVGLIVIDEEFMVEIFTEGSLEELEELSFLGLEVFLEVFTPDFFYLLEEELGIVFTDIEADLIGENMIILGNKIFEEISERLGLIKSEEALTQLDVIFWLLVFLF